MFNIAVVLAEQAPEANDVVAGWLAFWIFIAMAVATGLLLWSLTKQLRKVKVANEAGILPSGPKMKRHGFDQAETSAAEESPATGEAPAGEATDPTS